MDFENHVGSKVGIHHMFAPDEIDELSGVVKKSAFDKKYNEAWDSFFRDDVGNIVERSPKEILEFAQHMVEKYGIDGM